MSRMGKKPIAVPAGVKVNHDRAKRTVQVEGPKGRLEYVYHPEVTVEWDEGERAISCAIPENRSRDGELNAHWGTTRSRLQNMVEGVSQGFTKKLEIHGVGWNAKVMGKNLQLNVGYCNPIELAIPEGVTCTVEGNTVTITGYDKHAVGQFAALARSKREPEPYNAKGIKYSDEIIIRKQGKAFGS